jgi:DNA-binding GntR family transcriptional regulator
MNELGKLEKINIEKNLKDRVYEIIKNYVIQPGVPPGTRLYEERLSREIGVSRTPIKIALARLEHDGLVQTIANKGTFKIHLSWQEVTEVIKIRETLECLAIEIAKDLNNGESIENLAKLIPDHESFKTPEEVAAYPELDQKFHEELVRIGGSRLFIRMIESVQKLNHMLGFIILQDVEKVKQSIESHKKIINALKANDISLALSHLRQNYEYALKDLNEKRKTFPSLFL